MFPGEQVLAPVPVGRASAADAVLVKVHRERLAPVDRAVAGHPAAGPRHPAQHGCRCERQR